MVIRARHRNCGKIRLCGHSNAERWRYLELYRELSSVCAVVWSVRACLNVSTILGCSNYSDSARLHRKDAHTYRDTTDDDDDGRTDELIHRKRCPTPKRGALGRFDGWRTTGVALCMSSIHIHVPRTAHTQTPNRTCSPHSPFLALEVGRNDAQTSTQYSHEMVICLDDFSLKKYYFERWERVLSASKCILIATLLQPPLFHFIRITIMFYAQNWCIPYFFFLFFLSNFVVIIFMAYICIYHRQIIHITKLSQLN